MAPMKKLTMVSVPEACRRLNDNQTEVRGYGGKSGSLCVFHVVSLE